MGKYADLSDSIAELNKGLVKIRKDKELWTDDESVLGFLQLCYQTYYSQIHEYYVEMNSNEGEMGIRRCVKEIITSILPICEQKIKETRKTNEDLAVKFFSVYDDFYALAAFRSMAHYVQYMEFGKKNEDKIWQPTMHLWGGFWYYVNNMILKEDVKFISKQCFTGLGKTYSNAMVLSFIYGYDINADALYVFGASENVGTFATGLVELMISDRYSKVFPYYRQFRVEEDGVVDKETTANRMFTIKQLKDTGSKLRIFGTNKPVNLRVVSKDKNTNGVRAKYLFVDDIAQLADANNPKAHEKDIFRLTNEWYKRNYDLRHFFIIAGGTTYSVDDILTYLLRMNNGDVAVTSSINKFTSVAESNYIIKGGKSVFVRIPKLDYETDESTYPEKYPTEDARMQRDNALDNGRMFMAMEQQLPLSSDENPFDYGNIHIYDVLPKSDKDGGTRNSRCRFILDPSRKGKDKTCCLFFSQDGDEHFLVDAFNEPQPLDHIYKDGMTTLEKICQKIVQHRCFEGSAEENTESTIVSQIEKCLAKQGYGGMCKVEGYYSYQTKKDKIYAAQTGIQSYIHFPSRRVFAANSDVGRAMTDITYWKYKENIPDDAPECCAVYIDKYVGEGQDKYAVCHSFKR